MMMIEIKAAKPTDAPILTEIAHAAKRYWGYPEEYIRLWRADLTLDPQDVERWAVFVALDDDQIAGFYALSLDPERPEVEHLWLLPEYIGRGVGRQLFQHAVQIARDHHLRRFTILADPNAEGFYQKMGAVTIGEAPGRPTGRVLPLMVLHLDEQV